MGPACRRAPAERGAARRGTRIGEGLIVTVVGSRRLAVVSLLAASLAGALGGCSGGSTAAAGTPTSTLVSSAVPSTSSPAPTATPTPTETLPPLSKYEGLAPVKTMRAWAAALAKDVNAGDKAAPRAAKLSVASMASTNQYIVKDDAGVRHYPGPFPFTPTKVTVSGAKATVLACWWSSGWGLSKVTKRPDEPRQLQPTKMTLVKRQGRWLMETAFVDKFNCAGVKVKGVAW